MAPSRTHLLLLPLFLLLLLLHPVVVLSSSTNNVSFDFPSLTFRNLTLLGDAYIRNGVVGLTRDTPVPSASSGTVTYNTPVPFLDPGSNTTPSFSTRFTFSISNPNPSSSSSSYGDGLSFFLSQDPLILGSPGGYLGLVNSTQLTKNKFVAVEFDTRMDPLFDDPNENHIGLDIDSLTSVETVDLGAQGIDLKSGNWITCWIDYKNDLKVINVFLSYSVLKPSVPLLVVDVDLSRYAKEVMFVGFSGSSEGSTELHLVSNWSLSTSGFVPSRPKDSSFRPAHNVSDSSVIPPPVISVRNGTRKGQHKLGLGLGVAGPAFFCCFLVVFGYFSARKMGEMKRAKSLKAEYLVSTPREFGYRELSLATRGFHGSRIIGKGAFGNVYKALLVSSGMIAAVKRSKHSHEGRTEFLAELSIIASLRHKNLVQLMGWCVEKDELLLVYEFMPYGSLDKVLYQDQVSGSSINWPQRRNIVVGLASVLSYLHQECEQQVIHRDIKASNVMLDGNFNARLGDFGLARLMDHDKSPVSTLTAGTMGYLAPEYLQCGKATEKTDVYSFGVVVLEVACGRRPIFERETSSQKMVNLVDYVWSLYGEGRLLEAADKRLNGEYEEEEMLKLLVVGLSCVTPDSNERPTMRRVLQILNGEAEPIFVPKMKPSLTFSCGLALSVEDIMSDCE